MKLGLMLGFRVIDRVRVRIIARIRVMARLRIMVRHRVYLRFSFTNWNCEN